MTYISSSRLMGALVYRTRLALNANPKFIEALAGYEYSSNCLVGSKFNLWHRVGTHNEISQWMLDVSNNHPVNGALVKFPAVLDFVPVKQQVKDGMIQLVYNLAIAGSTNSQWSSQHREVQTFDLLLRPVYEELMRQIALCGYFELPYGPIPHTMYEVYTTGANDGILVKQYGEYIDAIELHNLTLTVRQLCDMDIAEIDKQNELVTANIGNLLNL